MDTDEQSSKERFWNQRDHREMLEEAELVILCLVKKMAWPEQKSWKTIKIKQDPGFR